MALPVGFYGSLQWIGWLSLLDEVALNHWNTHKEEGYNLEEVIQLDEVKEIEYIENDVLLYDSTKVRGPIKPHKKIPRSQIMKENVASSRGVDTREFAAGEGYSELFGNCKVYIFWNQCSYIAIKTKDLYILLNKKGDEQTYEFYSQLMEDLE